MKENKILKSLLSCLMTLSVISTAAVPVSAEETEIGPETTIEETVEEQAEVTVEKQAEEAAEKQAEAVVAETAEIEVEVKEDQTFEAELGGITVSVEAPAGAFPAGTEMILSSVGNDVYEAIGETVEGKVVAAVDITFVKDGIEKQPELPIKVAMNSAEIAAVENPVVVHVDDKAAELETEIVTQMDAPALDEVAFEADSFSVYAVIEPETTGDDARLFVHFKQANGADDIVIPVKKSDLKDESLFAQVLYDPGVGTLTGRQTFFGWTEKEDYTDADAEDGLSIDEVRTAVKDKLNAGIKEGDVLTYNLMLFDVYSVTFLDEDGAGIKTDAILVKDGGSKSYPINEAYDPKNTDSRFEGWGVASEKDGKWVLPTNEEELEVYANGSAVTFGTGTDTLSDDLVLRAYVPKGFWLIYKENGEGASFTPAEFYRGTATVRPTDPTRFGYTFGGWYLEETCETPFTHGSVLPATTRVYAKWNPEERAPYTVIIWLQNIEGSTDLNDYDFKEVVTVNNAVVDQNTAVSGTANGTTVTIPGNSKSYEGFHLKAAPVNVKVVPEGTSVVNVYFDRTQYTFTFQNTRGTTIHTVSKLYGQDISGIWEFDGSDGVHYPQTSTNTSWTPQNSQTYKARITALQIMPAENITWRLTNTSNTRRYFHYYVEVPDGETGDRTFQGLQFTEYLNLPNDFNLVTYNDDFWDLRGFNRLAIAKSNNAVVSLQPTQGIGWDRNDLTPPTGVTLVRQTLNGSYGGDNDHLYFYYTRQQYPITYWDGKYVDGNGVEITEGVTDRNRIHQSPDIDFDASIASYGEGGSNYYGAEDKIPQGFVFGGWYADKSCTVPYTFNKLPIDGVRVFAKWVLKQYRVFLYPNADGDDSFESGEQSTSFRIDYNEEIAAPKMLRDEYEFNGWYTTETLTPGTSFSFDSFTANDDTVTTEYDQTEPTEKDEYAVPKGNENRDKTNNRFWITHKLELYAKWRQKLIGTDGIEVVYDAVEGKGKFSDDSTTHTDPLRYQDDADAVAQGASTATVENTEFKQWVLYEWNGTDFVATETKVLPGNTFKVLASQARIVDNETGEVVPAGTKLDPEGSYTYTVMLKAEYGSIEAPLPTHMVWYSNIKDSDGNNMALDGFTHTGTTVKLDSEGWYIEDKEIKYNEAYDIKPSDTYSYDGYVFLGWAKLNESDPGKQSASTETLTEDDLFLKWIPAAEGSKADAGHYEAEIDGEWKAVQYVAADEYQPYDALYAVWYKLPVFKIDHSSVAKGGTGKVDTLVYVAEGSSASIATAAKAYASDNNYEVVDATAEGENAGLIDLTTYVKDNYFYGGYYKANGHDEAYEGGVDYWSAGNAWTTNGMKVDPSVLLNDANITDKTYYLKEVPEAYLKPTVKYVYNTYHKNIVRKLFMVSTIDDNNYSDLGMLTVGGKEANTLHLTPEYTITASDPSKAILLSTQELIKKDGLVFVWNLYEINNEGLDPEIFADYTDTIDALVENFETTVSLQVTTPDGVTVTRGSRQVTSNEVGTVIPGFAVKGDLHAKAIVPYTNVVYSYKGN